jgi:hypothetical protein
LTRGIWVSTVGWSLVHQGKIGKSQAILIENLDINYLLFEQAGELQRKGYGDRVIIPVQCSGIDETKPMPVSKEIAEVMIRAAQIRDLEIIPVKQNEPITYKIAVQVEKMIVREKIKSIILVSPGFRSRRDHLIYDKVLSPKGIKVYCVPVFGSRTPENWIHTWHGIQEILMQWGKLQYYRIKLS